MNVSFLVLAAACLFTSIGLALAELDKGQLQRYIHTYDSWISPVSVLCIQMGRRYRVGRYGCFRRVEGHELSGGIEDLSIPRKEHLCRLANRCSAREGNKVPRMHQRARGAQFSR